MKMTAATTAGKGASAPGNEEDGDGSVRVAGHPASEPREAHPEMRFAISA